MLDLFFLAFVKEDVADLRLLPLVVFNEEFPLPVLEAGNSLGIIVTKRAGIYEKVKASEIIIMYVSNDKLFMKQCFVLRHCLSTKLT